MKFLTRLFLWAITLLGSLFSFYYLYLAASASETAMQEAAAAGIGLLLVLAPFGLAYSVSAILEITSEGNDSE